MRFAINTTQSNTGVKHYSIVADDLEECAPMKPSHQKQTFLDVHITLKMAEKGNLVEKEKDILQSTNSVSN